MRVRLEENRELLIYKAALFVFLNTTVRLLKLVYIAENMNALSYLKRKNNERIPFMLIAKAKILFDNKEKGVTIIELVKFTEKCGKRISILQ